MQLSELLKNWPCEVKGSIRVEVEQIEDYLERIKPKQLVALRKGQRFNTLTRLDDAIANGASAIVVEDESFFLKYNPSVPLIWVPNVLKFVAYASHILNGKPSEVLKIVAVTGTNGKTTVTHFVSQFLQHLQYRTMIIGTNGIFVNGERLQIDGIEALTTISSIQLHRILAEAVKRQVEYVLVEASSIGLVQFRLDYCEIDVGVFLNLSQDHLDIHGTIEAYKLAKQRLVLLSKQLVFNRDDPFCKAVSIVTRKPKIEFSVKEKADVHFQSLLLEDHQTIGLMQDNANQLIYEVPFVFPHELSNLTAAIATMKSLGFSIDKFGKAIRHLRLPVGRLERFKVGDGIDVFVDYAHTPAAFLAVLQPLQHVLNYKRVIVVFGCGGERDRTKRVEMGRVASKYAHMIFLTTDNCRSESIKTINEQIKKGFFATQLYKEINNREEAIRAALNYAESGDVVIILGKGHEKYQYINGQVLNFSDQEVIIRWQSG